MSGTRTVRYGTEAAYVTRVHTNAVSCTNDVFGDPAPGADKSCWYADSTPAPATATPAPPTPPPTPTPPTITSGNSGPSVSAAFAADTGTDFPNPERGWYLYGSYGTGLFSGGFASDVLNNIKSNRYGVPVRLAFGYTSLANYTGTDTISSSDLATLDSNLAGMRTIGMKVIIRFFYGTGMSTPAASPGLARMQAHMAQIKPILAKYRDVIYLVQSGFIGNYGEWWFTNSGSNGTEVDSKAAKRAVQNAVLSMVPTEVPVATTCLYCTQEDWFPTVVSQAEAFSGSSIARTAFHNDCIMASANDQYQFPGSGTVNDFTFTKGALAQRQYIAAQSEFLPYGGETCAGSAQRLSSSGGTDNAGLPGGILNEGPRYHLAYLNRGYHTGFMDQWANEGTLGQVSRSMGYRFQFDSINHSSTATRGSTITVNVNMRNVGWARLYSARPLRVVLFNGSQTITGTGTTLLRQLPPQATSSTTISVPVNIPAAAAAGTWSLALDMPDIYSTTQSNDFKIRPANANNGAQSWDSTNFRFITGTSLTLQ